MDRYKVVFHINESNKWSQLLANTNNLIKDLGKENIIVEVVANGAAVIDYISNEDKVVATARELLKLGVIFTACRNSLLGNKIDEKLLPDFVEVIPAGVTELVKKQAEGYAYIKP